MKRTAKEGRPTEDLALVPYLLLLGKALAKQGRHEEAAGCFREVLRLDPESAEAEGGLGLSCLALGQNAEAVYSLERCLALHPGQADIHCNLGVALFRLQRLDEAIAHYRAALRLKPDYADAHNNLGNALRAAGQLDAASASLREAIRLRPTLPESHYLLGMILAQQGKLEDAADAFAQAIEHRPGYASAQQQRAHTLALLGRNQSARKSPLSPVAVPVSAGELVDKITILEIKAERISDPVKLNNVRCELSLLREAQVGAYPPSQELTCLTNELRSVNVSLWEIEDNLRRCEAAAEFGERFIELARSVYRVNDRRGSLKRRINELLGSRIIEEKCYADWQTSR